MRLTIPSAILLLAVAILLTHDASAVRFAAPKAISIGTVNLARVLEEVNERAEWDASLRAAEEKLIAEGRAKQDAINAKKTRLDEMPPSSPEATALREEMAMDILEADAWFKWEQARLDRERSLMWQDLYRSVRQEAEKLAAAEGLDLVIVNDSIGEIRGGAGEGSAEALVLQQITARRVLYSQNEIDVTDRLIVRMNNARAARPAAPASSGRP